MPLGIFPLSAILTEAAAGMTRPDVPSWPVSARPGPPAGREDLAGGHRPRAVTRARQAGGRCREVSRRQYPVRRSLKDQPRRSGPPAWGDVLVEAVPDWNPTGTPWASRNPSTSPTRRCSGCRLPSHGHAGDAPLPVPAVIVPPARSAKPAQRPPKRRFAPAGPRRLTPIGAHCAHAEYLPSMLCSP